MAIKKRTLGLAIVFCSVAALVISGTGLATAVSTGEAETMASEAPPAEEFLVEAEARLAALQEDLERAQWVQQTYITEDTELLAAKANERYIGAVVELAKKAARFDGQELPYDTARRLKRLKLALSLPAPSDAAEREELTRIAAWLESEYSKGEYCSDTGECRDLGELSRVIGSSRDADELLDVWAGWRTVSPPMREKYARFVELTNKGARELGFRDLGAMWRENYDMDPDAFSAELDRLFEQVRPLYEALHCHVRARLNATYGDDVVPLDKPIPAHLLGNMWAQSWGYIYPLVAPEEGESGYDLTEILVEKGLDEVEMVRYGERFFTSLGFDPLPETFWSRSQFTQPVDHDAVCHASAWDIDLVDDLRIKMCIQINSEDFDTIHHELGHSFYQRAYSHLPVLYRDSANDGFHEGVGDTISLSMTPKYLVDVGLLSEEPDDSADLGALMKMALEKVAFLPFGLLIDQWRWGVFSGEITPEDYNTAWWELREKYQGVRAPVERAELDFDPGAKYHIPSHTPYMRYFLAHILQFQFHRELCAASGYEGPLHRCSIYANKTAGDRLIRTLEMGGSRPWPEALEVMTGQDRMDATALLDYFDPLIGWLDEQNEGRSCGW